MACHPNSLKNLRPPRSRAEAPSRPVPIRLSPMELRRAAEAAHVNLQTVSEFIREAILDASSECLEERKPDS